MNNYTVTVRTADHYITYQALGFSSMAVHMHALHRYGICAVSVIPEQG